MALQFDPTIKASDILTSVTVLVSVVALVLSFAKDRAGRATEQADRVRSAAASAIVKLDRWQSVEASMYQELQPAFVELSEALAETYDVVAVRDRFWREVNQHRTQIARQILEEQLGAAYMDVISHFPAVRTRYVEAFAQLAVVEDSVVQAFLARAESDILDFEGKEATYQTAMLGNALRAEAARSVEELHNQSESVIRPVRDYLVSVIALSDGEILSASRTVSDSD